MEEFEQALMRSKEINLALVDIAGERSPDLGEVRSRSVRSAHSLAG